MHRTLCNCLYLINGDYSKYKVIGVKNSIAMKNYCLEHVTEEGGNARRLGGVALAVVVPTTFFMVLAIIVALLGCPTTFFNARTPYANDVKFLIKKTPEAR